MLGRLCLEQGTRETNRFRTQKTASLLAYLAFYKQRSHPRDVLTELFWPESSVDAARSSLSVALNALRNQLEAPGIPHGAILAADRSHVRLNPATFATDVEEYETLLHESKREVDPEKRVALQVNAVDLYLGDLLPGFYDDWILTERDRMRDTFMASLHLIIRGYFERRDYDRAIDYSHRLINTDPFQEEACFNMMRLYLAIGRPEAALHQYETLEELLRREMQVEPSKPIRELAARIRHDAPHLSLSIEAPKADPDNRSSQVDRLSSPGVKRKSAVIPFQFTRFFGRDSELPLISQLLEVDTRLITLTGPGGTGKTRLAIEVAGSVKRRFQSGIWFVPLSELSDPLGLGEVVRDALDLPGQPGSAALDQVVDHLNSLNNPCLLILDNFEQIAAGGALIVWTLLNRVRMLQCLVTSRQRLFLPGEHDIPVAPLPIPSGASRSSAQSRGPADLLCYPSVALFVDRAQSARAEFQITNHNSEAIASICDKLEGIPLAIELAASRARSMTPSQMLDRLSQSFQMLASRHTGKIARHDSLWAALDWSYQLLSPALQRTLACLSVFRGGCSLQAAEAVCTLQGSQFAASLSASTLDDLAQLRSHSLLIAEESSNELRFRMLETIREFALEKLRSTGDETTVMAAHLNWCLSLAVEAEPNLTGAEQKTWLEKLDTEYFNLQAAICFAVDVTPNSSDSAVENSTYDTGLQLCGKLCRFWEMRGHITEGRKLLRRALELPMASTDSPNAAKALNGAGMMALRQGDYSDARTMFERALAMNRKIGNLPSEALNLNNLGVVAKAQSDYSSAKLYFELALTISRQMANRGTEALNLGNLGILAYEQGNFPEARRLHEQALTTYRDLGDRYGEAMTLHNLGNLSCAQADFEQARALYLEALVIDCELGSSYGMVHRFQSMASLAVTDRHPIRAARLLGAEEALREEIGVPIPSDERAEYDTGILAARNMNGETALFDAAWQEGRKMPLAAAIEYALSTNTD